MWHQAKQSIQRFLCGYGLISHVRLRMASNEAGDIARPNIVLAQVSRWLDAKMEPEAITVFDALIVTTHLEMVLSLGQLYAVLDRK